MPVVDQDLSEVVKNLYGIEDLSAWLQGQRSAPLPDDRWDFPHEHGIIDLHDLEQVFEEDWKTSLAEYGVPFTVAELEVAGRVSEGIIFMQPAFSQIGGSTYLVREGVIIVFPRDEFSAVFLGNDDTFRIIEQSWEALFCILGAWRYAPEQHQRDAARGFLCDLLAQAMGAEE